VSGDCHRRHRATAVVRQIDGHLKRKTSVKQAKDNLSQGAPVTDESSRELQFDLLHGPAIGLGQIWQANMRSDLRGDQRHERKTSSVLSVNER
jgi:hypothetical protein